MQARLHILGALTAALLLAHCGGMVDTGGTHQGLDGGSTQGTGIEPSPGGGTHVVHYVDGGSKYQGRCGDGVIDPGEACDGYAFPAGHNCATETSGSKPYGPLSCVGNCAEVSTNGCYSSQLPYPGTGGYSGTGGGPSTQSDAGNWLYTCGQVVNAPPPPGPYAACGMDSGMGSWGLCWPEAMVTMYKSVFIARAQQHDCQVGWVCVPALKAKDPNACFPRCETDSIVQSVQPSQSYKYGACVPQPAALDQSPSGSVLTLGGEHGECTPGEVCAPCLDPLNVGQSTGACD